MPQRTNTFQKLILYINQSLIKDPNVIITESALIKDKKSENKREVDILIEYTEPYPIKIGIECQDRKRKTSQPGIEQLKSKHEQLNINKTIIVSRNGFTKGALKHAQHDEIELITLDDAIDQDWSEFIGSALSGLLISRKLFIKRVHFYAVDEINFQNLVINTSLRFTKQDTDSNNQKYIIDSYVFQRLKQELSDDNSIQKKGDTCWQFNPPAQITDINGASAEISALKIDYELKNTNIPLNRGSMGKNKFIYGVSTEIDGYDFMGAIITPSKDITRDGKEKLDITILANNKKQNKLL